MKLRIAIREWFKRKAKYIKLRLMARWSMQYGLTVVKIISRAGTDYIATNDGSLRRIGGKEKAAP